MSYHTPLRKYGRHMSAIDVGQTCLFGFSPLDTELFENKNNLLKRCRKADIHIFLKFHHCLYLFLASDGPKARESGATGGRGGRGRCQALERPRLQGVECRLVLLRFSLIIYVLHRSM